MHGRIRRIAGTRAARLAATMVVAASAAEVGATERRPLPDPAQRICAYSENFDPPLCTDTLLEADTLRAWNDPAGDLRAAETPPGRFEAGYHDADGRFVALMRLEYVTRGTSGSYQVNLIVDDGLIARDGFESADVEWGGAPAR